MIAEACSTLAHGCTGVALWVVCLVVVCVGFFTLERRTRP